MRYRRALHIAALPLVIPATAVAAPFQIDIEGVDGAKGKILVSIFDSKKGFPDGSEHAVRTISVPAVSGTTSVKLSPLPPGSYAVAAFHDQNGNSALDTSFLGIPREGYGFSREARGMFGPPAFEDAAVAVGPSGPEVLRLRLSY